MLSWLEKQYDGLMQEHEATKENMQARRRLCREQSVDQLSTLISPLVRMDRAHTRGNPAKGRSGNRDYGGCGREISVGSD